MNNGQLSGFRDQNPQDVLRESGSVSSANMPPNGGRSVCFAVDRCTSNAGAFMGQGAAANVLGSLRFDVVPIPAVVETGTGALIGTSTYNLVCGTSTTMVLANLTYDSGSNTTSIATWWSSDEQLQTWDTSGVVALGNFNATDHPSLLWTGAEYLLVTNDTTANVQQGFFSIDLTTWTSFTISSDIASNLIATVTASYVVTLTNVSGVFIARKIARPISASPTITTISPAPLCASLAALSNLSDSCIVGNTHTTDFATFTPAFAVSGTVIPTPSHVPNSYYVVAQLSTISYASYWNIKISHDGVTWKMLTAFWGSFPIPTAAYELCTAAGTVLLLPTLSAYDLASGAPVFANGFNIANSNFALVKARGNVYNWAGDMPMLMRLSPSNMSKTTTNSSFLINGVTNTARIIGR